MGCHTWIYKRIRRAKLTKTQYILLEIKRRDERIAEINSAKTIEELKSTWYEDININASFNVIKERLKVQCIVEYNEWVKLYNIRDSWGVPRHYNRANAEGEKYDMINRGYLYSSEGGDWIVRIYNYPNIGFIKSYKAFIRYYRKCYNTDSKSSKEGEGWTNDKLTKSKMNEIKSLFKHNKGLMISFG